MTRPRRSRFTRWLVRMLDRWLGRYYEGPDVPPRVTEEFRIWMRLNPDAAPACVEGYAVALLEAAYRDGFVRGYEWQERGWEGPAIAPEVLAEIEQQNWSLADLNPRVRHILDNGYDPEDPLANVSAPDKRAFFGMLAAAQDIRVIERPLEYQDDES